MIEKASSHGLFFISRREHEEHRGALATLVLAVRMAHTSVSDVYFAFSATSACNKIILVREKSNRTGQKKFVTIHLFLQLCIIKVERHLEE